MDKRIANIASRPDREQYLERTIDSLLPQVDQINVYLNGYKSKPDFLDHEKITSRNSKKDLGASGKFYFLDKLKEPAYYFTCDDDLIYPKDYVNYLVHMIDLNGRKAVIGTHGTIYQRHPIQSYYADASRKVWYCHGGNDRTRFVHMLGTGAMAFHTSLLPDLSVKDFPEKNMCDPQFAKYLHERNIPAVCLIHGAGWIKEQAGSQEKAIWKTLLKGDSKQTEVINSINPFRLITGPVADRSHLGGASISEQAFVEIVREIPTGGKILEFGSGRGTGELAKFFDVVTVEHDPAYMNKVPGVRYIHKKIKGQFYDITEAEIQEINPDIIIVDGPPGAISKRSKFADIAENLNVPMIVDDVHRANEQELLDRLNREFEIRQGKDKSYAIVFKSNN